MKMIKKLTALLVLAFVCLALVGCGSVAGKTYVFDSFEYELAEDLTAIEKGVAEGAATLAKKAHENVEVTFNEDGTTSLGLSYTQDGSTLTFGGNEYKVKGSKLVLEVEKDDYSYTVTYVVKK